MWDKVPLPPGCLFTLLNNIYYCRQHISTSTSLYATKRIYRKSVPRRKFNLPWWVAVAFPCLPGDHSSWSPTGGGCGLGNGSRDSYNPKLLLPYLPPHNNSTSSSQKMSYHSPLSQQSHAAIAHNALITPSFLPSPHCTSVLS